MAIYFIEETAGAGEVKHAFYNTDLVDYATIPAGAVEVSAEDYEALMAGQAAGGTIIANSEGYPILISTTGETSTCCHFKKTSIDEASITKITGLSYVLAPSGAVIGTDQTQDYRTKIEFDDTMVYLYANALGDEAGVYVNCSNAHMYARTNRNEADIYALSNEVYLTIKDTNGEITGTGKVSFNTTGISVDNPNPFNFSPSASLSVNLGLKNRKWLNLYVDTVNADTVMSTLENTAQLQATTAYIENLYIDTTDVKAMFGASLASNDNKRITLRSASNTGLSNFDPASIIANVLQGRKYGSTAVHGGIGSIGLFMMERNNSVSVGDTVSGTMLCETAFGSDSSDGGQITYKRCINVETASPITKSGSWVILTTLADGFYNYALVLAVRVA